MALQIERKEQHDPRSGTMPSGRRIAITPPLDEDYWSYRVRLAHDQAIVGFPKFFTIGIGFAVEDEDWNTNLPYKVSAEEILEHIRCNKKYDDISDADCLEAIRLIQAAVREDQGGVIR